MQPAVEPGVPEIIDMQMVENTARTQKPAKGLIQVKS